MPAPSTSDLNPPAPPSAAAPARPLGGIATGVALVLLAVVAGVIGQHAADGGTPATPAAAVTATGHTTTLPVTAKGMRYQPDHLAVPAGDRLVIVLTNADDRRHDLVLANGARTSLLGKGDTARLDAGIIGGTVQGWCSQPAHRASGMTLTITATGTASGAEPAAGSTAAMPGMTGTAGADRLDPMADPGPGFTARDAALPPAPAGREHRITLHAQQVRRDVAAGINQQLWTFNGTTPAPVLRGRIGDTFEVTLVNDTTVEHGIDFHVAALAPDTGMRTVEPGQSIVYRFTAGRAGIWMYHCSAMPMLYHVGNGMYGALIIDPPDLSPVDGEYLLVQSEFYLGAQGQAGDAAKMASGRPDVVVFNGYASQYAFRPLTARAGQRVRIWLLDAGPNRSTAFHVVGAPFDTVYAEGGYRLRPADPGGAQILDLAPGSGGFIETRFDQPGGYPFLSHALADADLGARGTIRVTG
ncbi:multicopper oxidase domain-containing protein [Dactylosporangium sp. NPDC048998]|uniref:multicopper oxidase domain-containing protein n=1 Tax=Dactylosporangium sp. NPDC048998 TaxID=3363976 RepID=UPI00371A0841